MKRHLTASICVLIACASPVLAQAPDWREYFPLKIDHKWTYIVNADPKKKVVIEVERTEDYTRKEMKDDKKIEEKFTGFILKTSSGDKVTRDHVVVMDDGVYRIHAAGTLINPPLLFFKFHIKSGEAWNCDSVSGNTTIKGTSTASHLKNQGADGKTDYWKIEYNNNKPGDERIQITYWFARGYGMIQQHVKMKNHDITLKLEKFQPAK
jgi:hypothetical protein